MWIIITTKTKFDLVKIGILNNFTGFRMLRFVTKIEKNQNRVK